MFPFSEAPTFNLLDGCSDLIRGCTSLMTGRFCFTRACHQLSTRA